MARGVARGAARGVARDGTRSRSTRAHHPRSSTRSIAPCARAPIVSRDVKPPRRARPRLRRRRRRARPRRANHPRRRIPRVRVHRTRLRAYRTMNYPIDPRTSPAPVVSSRRAPSVVVVGGGLKIFKFCTDNHHRSIASPHTRSRAIRSSIASGVRPTRPQSSIERGVARARRVKRRQESRSRPIARPRPRGDDDARGARARERRRDVDVVRW